MYLSGVCVWLDTVGQWEVLLLHYLLLRLTYAVNPNAPTITDLQLAQVLFRCTDQAGGIVGNSYCIVNCAVIGDDTVNDMCTM
ncbi:hypothetical protein TsFJ059_005403 [Trichoderma semiorbis]|uniref:Uncharacterized protein n=1 Tax=Trichoderma semiorbis TaxID=1491008 RepID=A0A9P8HXY1_9HYPO|nr:hypothetical protein TsFJ059_005403 [Trichoderma semiorbis]